MPEREVMDVREAAAFLRVSPRTIARRIAEGKLPAFKVLGDNLRLNVDDLRRAAAEQPVTPTKPGERP
jgi:excisionase family DNA binding protein